VLYAPPVAGSTEDHDEILQLLYRYNHAIDGGDADAWADTWTDDGVFDSGNYRAEGRDALLGVVKGAPPGFRHVVVNPSIDVDGDRATMRAYLLLLRRGALAAVGDYRDELVRTPQGWRFAQRLVAMEEPPA